MSLKEKVKRIKSISDIAGFEYDKPDPSLVLLYQEQLKENQEACGYLKERNINQEAIDHFKLGYDSSRHAISIPVYKDQELINIKYRLLEPDRHKYSQEKGCEVWIYNEEGIKKGEEKGGLLIVEGEFDLISCWQAGIENVVSPASGKDSYGPWLEMIDDVDRVWIAYDNDEPGLDAAEKLSQRIGEEKTRQVLYPDDIKDANDYFKEYTVEDFRELIKDSQPFHSHSFATIGDVINNFRDNSSPGTEIRVMPGVKLRDDHVVVVSGKTNAGKTTYVLNIAVELVNKNIPTLVLPFERGIKDVGPRFLSIDMNATEDEMRSMQEEEWNRYIKKIRGLPLYFAVPDKQEIQNTIRRAKRIFNVQTVIIDHLDYIASQSVDKFRFQSELMHTLKEFAIEESVNFIIVHHPKKGSQFNENARLTNEDLGGSISIPQVAETVFMVESDLDQGFMTPYCTKNKGDITEATYQFTKETGKIGEEVTNNEFETITATNHDEF